MIVPPDNSSLYRSAEGYQTMMERYDAALQGMAVPYETRYVETSFGPTHIVIGGREDGKPVVLWHSQNANMISWLHWLPALAPTCRSHVVDVIGGAGRSASRPTMAEGLLTEAPPADTLGLSQKCHLEGAQRLRGL